MGLEKQKLAKRRAFPTDPKGMVVLGNYSIRDIGTRDYHLLDFHRQRVTENWS
jgi:hypothetical protein